ncbi:MAG TPA: DUF6116 family protein [Thermoanaerobaculia bacterium]|nr:DUF6116 family protein [Thermoanaerobaculia bacterium]
MSPSPTSSFVQRAATRLRFPQLFAVMLAIFLFDVVFPDLVPFVDEILLGLGTALFGMWREPVPAPPSAKPPMKNVTPPD